jgi:hypothetical protein
LGAALAYFCKRRWAIYELAPVGLPRSDGNLFPQFGESQLLDFLALLQQAQALAKDLALGLVVTGFQEVGYKSVEGRPKVDVHGFNVRRVTITVNY